MLYNASFKPAWWLRNPHLQTLYASLARRGPKVSFRRERVELPDGDFIDLDWAPIDHDEAPVVIVLHGLEGSSASNYVQGITGALTRHGYRAVVMHFRGCSGEINRVPTGYHSGETRDLAAMIDRLRGRWPQRSFAAIGYSLGGNVLLKYLGERGADAGLSAGVAVSVPLLLSDCTDRLNRGFSRLYQAYLLSSLVRKTRYKFSRMQSPIPLDALASCRTIRQYDHIITAPLHGFVGADDYYTQSSSRQYLRHIAVPTLVIQARDDPFMTPAVLPADSELAPSVRLEISAAGGHVGFVGGCWRPHYWLEQRIPAFLNESLGRQG